MTDTLREYAAKRKFEATPEPPAAVAAREGPLLFVVQMHRATRLHYDFRLECDGVLKSWAVPKGPSLNPADKRMAVPTEDHPYDYASFEGVIPPGQYGAGEVIVWDCGVYSPDEDEKGRRGPTWFHDRERAEALVRKGLAAGKLSFTLRGAKLKGSFALVRTKQGWLLIKHKDRFATEDDVTAQDRSVLGGATVAEMKSRPARRLDAGAIAVGGKTAAPPPKLEPMQAQLGDRVLADDRWSWEPKLDGYRVLAHLDDKGVVLRSRRGLDLTGQFPALVAELAQQQAPGTILDGEIVVLDAAGKPSFNALQNRAQLKTARELVQADREFPAVYYAFDLPYFAGVDLRVRAYTDRRRYLAQCLLPSPLVRLVHAQADGEALRAAALASGLEGVMGKRNDSRYEAGQRSPAWIKVKPVQSAEFVIGGYTAGKGSRGELGAIAVGYWDGPARKKVLKFASGVGSGFDDRMLKSLLAKLKPLARKTMPFDEKPELLGGPPTWVEPELVCEVQFQQWTDDGHLRAPVFLRLRDDIEAKDVTKAGLARAALRGSTKEPDSRVRGNDAARDVLTQLDSPKNAFTLEVGPHKVPLTHLDRVYWPADPGLKQPAITKRELLRYFTKIAPHILRHLADRPLTMIRMPGGIHGQRFFQKHWEQEKPAFADTITIFSGHNEKATEYLVCSNLPTLLWLAQSGTLEFHIWHSRSALGPDTKRPQGDFASSEASLEASILNYPDYVVFDIDPYIYSGQEQKGGEPELNTVAFEKGKEVAFWLRELLDQMKLESIVKTSGKTGLHVFVPIKRTIDFDAARQVSELVGRHLLRAHPKDITMDWKVEKRTGKIFMDHNMNVRGKTLNVAYSPRGVSGAPVSMPLTWDELASAHPLDFRITNAAERVARLGDRWQHALTGKQSLERALKGPDKA